MLQATTVMSALLVWGGVHSDAFLMPGGGGAPSAWIDSTRPSSVRAAAMMRASAPLAACTAARSSTISAQLQSAPPPEGFEWGYDSSVGADAGGADAGSSPEELLLKAIEALREQDLEGARGPAGPPTIRPRCSSSSRVGSARPPPRASGPGRRPPGRLDPSAVRRRHAGTRTSGPTRRWPRWTSRERR